MRLLPGIAGFLMIAGVAAAQPAPEGPPPGPPAIEQVQQPQQQQNAAPRMTMRQRFEAANTTRDGRLTREQAEAAGMRGIARHFDQIDTDRKGYVTIQDFRAYQQQRRQARAARQPGGAAQGQYQGGGQYPQQGGAPDQQQAPMQSEPDQQQAAPPQ